MYNTESAKKNHKRWWWFEWFTLIGVWMVTHSEMWTKMSSPPWQGWMKPWPCDLEKFLHTPLNTGPEWARTVLQEKTEKQEVSYRSHKHSHLSTTCCCNKAWGSSLYLLFCVLQFRVCLTGWGNQRAGSTKNIRQWALHQHHTAEMRTLLSWVTLTIIQYSTILQC